MGLDSFWVDANREVVGVEGDFNICGGMLSDHGNRSFRGKVYSDIIKQITGESLYQEYISPEKVKEMSKALEETTYDEVCTIDSSRQLEEKEYSDLVAMFSAHSKANHGLVGWW